MSDSTSKFLVFFWCIAVEISVYLEISVVLSVYIKEQKELCSFAFVLGADEADL